MMTFGAFREDIRRDVPASEIDEARLRHLYITGWTPNEVVNLVRREQAQRRQAPPTDAGTTRVL
jgi:hypothetical protein